MWPTDNLPVPRPGHPSDWSPDRQADIVKLILRGVRPVTAAIACGLSNGTHYTWLGRGEGTGRFEGKEPKEPYISYARAIREAEATLEIELTTDLKEVVKGDAKNLMQYLSSRFREGWGQKPDPVVLQHQAQSTISPALQNLMQNCTLEEYQEFLKTGRIPNHYLQIKKDDGK